MSHLEAQKGQSSSSGHGVSDETREVASLLLLADVFSAEAGEGDMTTSDGTTSKSGEGPGQTRHEGGSGDAFDDDEDEVKRGDGSSEAGRVASRHRLEETLMRAKHVQHGLLEAMTSGEALRESRYELSLNICSAPK